MTRKPAVEEPNATDRLNRVSQSPRIGNDRTPPAQPATAQPRASQAATERVADAILAAMGLPERHATSHADASPWSLATPEAPPFPPLGSVVRLSEVSAEPIHWLSPGRLALGKITVLDGDPGLGKSTLLCEFAARVTQGQPLPGGQPSEPRGVILLAAEDGLFDTIRPRLDAAGGDPRRVVTLVSVPDRSPEGRPFALPGDAPLLAALAVHTDSALVIIDPLAGFLGPRHSASDAGHVRRTFAALREVAERADVAVVVVRHLNKATGANPLYRGGGSIGVIGSARCGLLLASDPADPERRILAASKENLTAQTPSLAFRLATVPGSGVARVVWEGETRCTASQLLHGAAETTTVRSALAEARQWLRTALADGPRPGKALQEEAAAHGHAQRTLVRARLAEDIIVRKQPGPNGHWTWELPRSPTDSTLPERPSSPTLLPPERGEGSESLDP